jgi:hypothetical protein
VGRLDLVDLAGPVLDSTIAFGIGIVKDLADSCVAVPQRRIPLQVVVGLVVRLACFLDELDDLLFVPRLIAELRLAHDRPDDEADDDEGHGSAGDLRPRRGLPFAHHGVGHGGLGLARRLLLTLER